MLARIKDIWTNDEGVEVVEVALVLTLVAIATILGYTALGGASNAKAQGVANKLDSVTIP